MGIIVPAIIPVSKQDLDDKLGVLSGLATDIQVDIVDGRYATPASWPYREDAGEPARMLAAGDMLPRAGDFKFEIDLMAEDPESVSGTWIGLGAVRLTVHAESTRSLARFFDSAQTRYGHDSDFSPGLLSIGLALGTETDIALIEPYLDRVEFVQFMGVRTIGRQGEPFDTRVLARIAAFRKKHPEIPVQVDGGVSLANAPKLLQAGVSRLVVGSALWKAPNVAERYREFNTLTEEHGIYG